MKPLEAAQAQSPLHRPSGAGPAVDPREALREIEVLIEELGQAADPVALGRAQALVRAVLDLHAAGLARIIELVRAGGTPPLDERWLVQVLAADDLVANLLLLHGIHPIHVDIRARATLLEVTPPGWNCELLNAEGGVLRVAIRRTGDPARVATSNRVRELIEQALDQAAPDAEGLELSGDVDDARGAFVPLERLRSRGLTGAPGLR